MLRLQHNRRNAVVTLLEIPRIRSGNRNGLETHRLISAAGERDRLRNTFLSRSRVWKCKAQDARRQHGSHRGLPARRAQRRKHRQNLRGLLEKRLADRSRLTGQSDSRIDLIDIDSENTVGRACAISEGSLRILQLAEKT